MDTTNFMSWFNLAIGAYVAYAAIAGKGKAYENEYPQEIKESVYKLNRLMYATVGPIMVVLGVLELLGVPYVNWISIIFVFAIIVTYLIIFYSRYGKVLKEARKKKF